MNANTRAAITVKRSRFFSTTVEPAIAPPACPAEHVRESAPTPRVQAARTGRGSRTRRDGR